MTHPPSVPRWVWLMALAVASLQPMLHLWLAYAPPEGTVSTGLTLPDTVLMLLPMRMFEDGFFSPFATCQAPGGPSGVHLYPLPADWLYGLLGLAANALRLDHFVFLGIANGAAGTLYLVVLYLFFREIVPKHANTAFVLFTLTSGPGGILFIVTGLLGLHSHPSFELYFYRFALADLLEDQSFVTAFHLSRLYYTLSLALGFTALTLVVRAHRRNAKAPFIGAMMALFFAAFIHLVLGFLAWGVAMLYLYCQGQRPGHRPLGPRLRAAACLTLPLALAWLAGFMMLRQNPVFLGNFGRFLRTALWLSPFLVGALFHLFLAPQEVLRGVSRIPRLGRLAAGGLVGYLLAFFVLYCGYQVYYGNLLATRDFAVAVAISDWALIGVIPGLAFAIFGARMPRVTAAASASEDAEAEAAHIHGWLALWVLLSLAASISAFGQGWYLRLGPVRAAALLSHPICILSAFTLVRLKSRRPRVYGTVLGAMVACGLCSILAGTFYLGGSLGYRPGEGPFAQFRSHLMTLADAELQDAIGEGTVLAPMKGPMFFGDIIALRKGNPAISGMGAFTHSDQPLAALQEGVNEFFSPQGTPQYREELAKRWCIDYVYCPDTCPIDESVLEQLRTTPWLEEVARADAGAVFRVTW